MDEEEQMREFFFLEGVCTQNSPEKKTPDRKNLLLAVKEADLSVGMCGEGAENDIVGLFLQLGFGWKITRDSQISTDWKYWSHQGEF